MHFASFLRNFLQIFKNSQGSGDPTRPTPLKCPPEAKSRLRPWSVWFKIPVLVDWYNVVNRLIGHFLLAL